MKGYFDKGKTTRREKFLAEMERVVPWARLYALILPAAVVRPVRPGADEALYDSITMRRFAGLPQKFQNLQMNDSRFSSEAHPKLAPFAHS
jgi:hypothetical protein